MVELLLEQSEIIGKLTALCDLLINELAQYKEVEQEELMLRKIKPKEETL